MMEERNLSRLRVSVCSYSLPVQTLRELGRGGKENDDEEGGGGREGETAGGTALAALFVKQSREILPLGGKLCPASLHASWLLFTNVSNANFVISLSCQRILEPINI